MLSAQPVCTQEQHEESKRDPEGYGLRALGPGCGGVFYECPECPSTLFVPGPTECPRCDDTGRYERDGYTRLQLCDCEAGDRIRAANDEARIAEWEVR